MELWLPQRRLIDGVNAAREAGYSRILACLPTGLGKSFCAVTWMKDELTNGGKVAFYTNRRMLLEQSAEVFGGQNGMEHGIRAAGHPKHRWLDFQICSIQSELSWLKQNTEAKPDRHQLHKATLVIVDEGHLNCSAGMLAIMGRHVAEGATIILLTATPIGMGHAADFMVVGGNNSDGRECGALVAANHYGPDEPDYNRFKGIQEGDDLTEKQNASAMMTPGIFGRVFEHFKTLNPDGRPTLAFAPGVRESIAFAEDFKKRGVRVAHIDADDVWVDGERHASSRDARDQVLQDHKSGRIKVIFNRFLLREGVDTKWVEHMIFATVFGSLQSYLQSGGRGLRACPETGKRSVCVQDHGANWLRHGSLNADREWKLEYTGRAITGMRLDRIRNGKEREPCRCPQCKRVLAGRSCPCGYQIVTKSRTVVQSDGRLIEITGDCYKPKKIDTRPDAMKRWEKVYWRARKSKKGMSFKQAFALFAYENGWNYPDHKLPLMPIHEIDNYRRVADVPMDRLTSRKS